MGISPKLKFIMENSIEGYVDENKIDKSFFHRDFKKIILFQFVMMKRKN